MNQKPIRFPQAVIFDLDGVILDSESLYIHAWQQAIETMGFHFNHNLALSMLGLNHPIIDQTWQDYYGSEFNLKQFHQFSADYWYLAVNTYGIKIKPGLNDLLSCLQQYHIPYAVATNSPKTIAHYCLNIAQLSTQFPLIVSAEQVSQAKPAADIFAYAAAQLACPISDCWILEDSLVGIQAAQTAGGITVWIAETECFAVDSAASPHLIKCHNLTQVAQHIHLLHSQIEKLQL